MPPRELGSYLGAYEYMLPDMTFFPGMPLIPLLTNVLLVAGGVAAARPLCLRSCALLMWRSNTVFLIILWFRWEPQTDTAPPLLVGRVSNS